MANSQITIVISNIVKMLKSDLIYQENHLFLKFKIFRVIQQSEEILHLELIFLSFSLKCTNMSDAQYCFSIFLAQFVSKTHYCKICTLLYKKVQFPGIANVPNLATRGSKHCRAKHIFVFHYHHKSPKKIILVISVQNNYFLRSHSHMGNLELQAELLQFCL